MNQRVTIEIEAKSVGHAFAYTDDRSQAEMLNEMGLELEVYCGRHYEMQICVLSKHLDKKGIKLIKSINEFLELRDE